MSSAGISFGGLASGLDTQAIISALLAIEQRPITQLELKKKSLSKQKSLFGDLDGLLDKLSSAAKKLKTTNQFLAMAASSDDEDVLTASASSGAAPGSHRVEVLELARAQLNHSNGRASATESLGGYGEFILDIDGEQLLISVSDPTMQGIADAINAKGSTVRAEVVDTGSPTDPYQLVLRSTETGTDNAFSISGLTGATQFTDLINEVTTNQTDAENAHIKLNGVDIYRSTNSISGAIAGVTLDLKSVNTPDEVTVSVSTDAEEISGKVEEFVEAYNAVVDFFAAQSIVSEEGEAQSDLFGDPTLRSMRSTLRGIVGGVVSATGNEAFQMLSQIGISSDRDGKLTFTRTELEEALSEDETAVAAIFTDPENGLSALLEDQIKVYTDSVDGLIKARLDGFDTRIKDANNRIEQAERRLELYETQLEKRYANLESMLARLQGQGSSLSAIPQIQQ